MAIFKKKQGADLSFPEIPEFPEAKKVSGPSFPAFSPKDFPSLKDIKDAIKPLETKGEQPKEPKLEPLPKLDLPKLTETMTYEPRQESRYQPPEEAQLSIPLRQKSLPVMQRQMPMIQPRPIQRQMPRLKQVQRPMQPQMERPMSSPLSFSHSGKPLFVQIDEYNRIIDTVNNLKLSIQEAEHTLSSLKQLKERENDELIRWEDNLNKVKDKLLTIDKRLSER